MKKVLFIIPKEGFRDEEYDLPKKKLEAGGYQVVTASTTPGEASGKLGMKAEVTAALPDVVIKDYLGLACIGGPGSPQFWDDHLVHDLVREAGKSGLVVAGICSAVITLARAGVLADRKATVWPGDGELLTPLVKAYTEATCEVDGPFITANGPEAAQEFADALLLALEASD